MKLYLVYRDADPEYGRETIFFGCHKTEDDAKNEVLALTEKHRLISKYIREWQQKYPLFIENLQIQDEKIRHRINNFLSIQWIYICTHEAIGVMHSALNDFDQELRSKIFNFIEENKVELALDDTNFEFNINETHIQEIEI